MCPLNAGVAVVVGAGLGATGAVVGQAVAARFQANREATSWRRDQKQGAYDTATLALLRVRNRRRRMVASQWATIPPEELPTYVDNLVDAQHRLWMLLVACGEDQRETLRTAVKKFDELVDEMLAKPPPADLVGTFRRVDEVWDIVLTAQGQDVGTDGARRRSALTGRRLRRHP